METEKHTEDEATEVEEQSAKVRFREDEADEQSDVEEQRKPVRREDEDEDGSDEKGRMFSDATLKREITPIASPIAALL